MKKIGRYVELVYFFTDWFNKPSDLRINFTELNENGVALQKYCYGNKDFILNLTESNLCITNSWTLASLSLSNYTNQYEYVTERFFSHKEAYLIHIDISFGQHGTCRDVHFSIKT